MKTMQFEKFVGREDKIFNFTLSNGILKYLMCLYNVFDSILS